jgi:hypothetical protein
VFLFSSFVTPYIETVTAFEQISAAISGVFHFSAGIVPPIYTGASSHRIAASVAQ